MDNTERFHNKKMVVAEFVGFTFEALQICTDDLRLLQSWTTLRRFTIRKCLLQKRLVGFRFEADLCKSEPVILGSGFHGQH